MPAFKLTCKRCGVSRIALRLERCTHCGKYVCVNCFTNKNEVNLCLDCHGLLISDFQREVLSSYGDRCPICGAEGKLEIKWLNLYRKNPNPQAVLIRSKPNPYGELDYDTEVSCKACGNVIDRMTMQSLNSAWKAEKSGRHEDAAREYERLGLLDKAKALREIGKTTIVKHQYVDVNHLLEQIRQGNLVVPYRCPNCQAGITINKDTSVNRLANCPYCGSALVVSDIEKFLSSIL